MRLGFAAFTLEQSSGQLSSEAMDGFANGFSPQTILPVQRTLKTSIACVGVGLHSGHKLEMTLHPAPAGTGIVFRRTDADNWEIPARYDHVADTRLCTVLACPDRSELRIGTVEHVLAALAGCGVSNAIVAVNGPELPILDGSAASFVFLIDCAGIIDQGAVAPVIEVRRPVAVAHGEAFAELHPASTAPAAGGFEMDMSIDFDAAAIGCQALAMRLTPEAFRADLARARTFTLVGEVASLRAAGLALGGNLDNCVVVDNARVLNAGGLRMPDEFVRHKLLDAVGDFALAGAVLHGRFVAHRSGHALNNHLLRALFADPANWRLLSADVARVGMLAGVRMGDGSAVLPGLGSWQDRRLPVAAAPV
jgi:UDP-3-O-[3-hydroxymyristoyl] N-acetylglucosamine deacetylase